MPTPGGEGAEYTVHCKASMNDQNRSHLASDGQPSAETVKGETVPTELAGTRLDRAMAQMFPEYSRSRLKHWIDEGHVTIDGQQRRGRDPVCGGEEILLTPQREAEVLSRPEPITLDIVYEDDDCLVVNKPAGLVVHPGAGNTHGTMMNGLLHHSAALTELPRAGIVHRLDKDTSGLLLVAKTLEAHTALVRQLAERQVTREYLAVCTGVLTGGGKIDAAIGRHPVERRKMCVRDGGKTAVTHYRVQQRFRGHTLVRVKLETGRTHQIRVHFAHRRHALVGDPVYAGRLAVPAGAGDELIAALRRFRRQALHASRLAFSHPHKQQEIDLAVPPPADLEALIETLGADAKTDIERSQ